MVLGILYTGYKLLKKGSQAFVIAVVILAIIMVILLITGMDKGWTTGRKMEVVVLLLCAFMLYRWKDIIMLIIYPEDVIIDKGTDIAADIVSSAVQSTAESIESVTEAITPETPETPETETT